jgi:hypothetical protein
MATHPAAPSTQGEELRAALTAMRERNAERRERVLQHAANLGRIADKLRTTQRPR